MLTVCLSGFQEMYKTYTYIKTHIHEYTHAYISRRLRHIRTTQFIIGLERNSHAHAAQPWVWFEDLGFSPQNVSFLEELFSQCLNSSMSFA